MSWNYRQGVADYIEIENFWVEFDKKHSNSQLSRILAVEEMTLVKSE